MPQPPLPSLPTAATNYSPNLLVLKVCNTSMTGRIPAVMSALTSLQLIVSPKQCGLPCDPGYVCTSDVLSARAVPCESRVVCGAPL